MPVIITKDGTDYYLVPAPLVSFSRQTYNNVGRPQLGADYNITLEGTLLPNKGNPFFAMTGSQPVDAEFSTDNWAQPSSVSLAGATNEPDYGYDENYLLASTLRKQEKIRSLFSNDVVSGVASPVIVNISNWGETTKGLKFAAFVNEISFGSESRGVNPGSYSINLTCDSFIDSANNGEFDSSNDELNSKYSIISVNEGFSIAENNQFNLTFSGVGVDTALDSVNKIYSISRNTTVVGAPRYDQNGAYVSGAPWQQASGYLYEFLGSGIGILPTGRALPLSNFSTSGYKVANTTITEDIDKEAGSYTITENSIIYSGDPVIHNLSVDVSTDVSQRRSVSIQGTIEGLNTEAPFNITTNKYANASAFSSLINPTGYGVIPSGYFYAKSVASLNWLNPKPQSTSLSRDPANGTINYSYSFDDRPPNLVSGSLQESITVNDTYPGELFSATPVIGRNQPVLQYLNSRSEYKRNLSINITMSEPTQEWSYGDAADGYWSGATQSNIQKMFINDKPSNISISSGNLNTIFEAINPVNDPNFTVRNGKCFHSAPNETWDANSRSYSYSIEWVYEREV
jgi:hypothetical protein